MGEKALRRTRRNHALWDKMVNDKFEGQPVLSAEESVKAALKLYRHFMKRAWTGRVKVVSGNRRTYLDRGVFFVNPDRQRKWGGDSGYRAMIHDLSHHLHWRLHSADKPHSIRQARMERDMADIAIKRNWLNGALLPKPKAEPVPKPVVVVDKVQQRYQRMVKRRDKYAKELERSKRLFAKATRETKAYERRHGERLV